jgi:hypothetical protein
VLPETAPARTAPVTLLAVPRLPMLACLLTTTMITVHLSVITQLSSVIRYPKNELANDIFPNLDALKVKIRILFYPSKKP